MRRGRRFVGLLVQRVAIPRAVRLGVRRRRMAVRTAPSSLRLDTDENEGEGELGLAVVHARMTLGFPYACDRVPIGRLLRLETAQESEDGRPNLGGIPRENVW